MVSPHYWIHAVTLLVIGLLVHKQFTTEPLIGCDQPSTSNSNRHKTLPPNHNVHKETENHGPAELPSTKSESADAPGGFEEGEATAAVGVEMSSSVWCHGLNVSDRICQFRNLCYHPEADQFVFFIGSESLVENLSELDMRTSVLDLSSAVDHNGHPFTFITLPSEASRGFAAQWVSTPSFAFSRFKPDNLMHVLHDDILPVHRTLTLIFGQVKNAGKFDVQLVFLEGWEPEGYWELYSVFSPYPPMFRHTLRRRSRMTCFRNIHLGLSKSTLWYQYGFVRPQNPVPHHVVTARQIRSATRYIQERLQETEPQVVEPGYYVLACRRENRLILNEAALSQNIARELKVKVVHVTGETHTVGEAIGLVSGAAGLVGMHGASLALAMFLRPGAVVLELFPFGVSPENYTPYKTLAGLPGMGLVYRAWRNRDAANTIVHPDWPAELGGVEHLSADDQSRILSETEVRAHLCCADPSWLFRIYQDTIVNVDQVLALLTDAAQDTSHVAEPNPEIGTFPSPVREVQCSVGLSATGLIHLTISWREPWNVQFLALSKLHYEVLVRDKNSEDHMKFLVSSTTLTLPTVEGERSVLLWIRALVDDMTEGPFVNVLDCHT